MSRPHSAPRAARVALLVGGAALLLGAALLQGDVEPQLLRAAPARDVPRVMVAAPLAEPKAAPTPIVPKALSQPVSDGAVPAGFDRTRHAHPITAEHLRLYREDDLLGGAWQALRRRDFQTARQLVAAHQAEYPDSKAHMDEGLLLLADCMQSPSAEHKARAQAFYDSKTYSPLRRRLRRSCLELP
ncbi:MAG TPA: hypothetical protein VIW29_19740 [Polyangiaceae bacterium]